MILLSLRGFISGSKEKSDRKEGWNHSNYGESGWRGTDLYCDGEVVGSSCKIKSA